MAVKTAPSPSSSRSAYLQSPEFDNGGVYAMAADTTNTRCLRFHYMFLPINDYSYSYAYLSVLKRVDHNFTRLRDYDGGRSGYGNWLQGEINLEPSVDSFSLVFQVSGSGMWVMVDNVTLEDASCYGEGGE
jgi:hypothetical protein